MSKPRIYLAGPISGCNEEQRSAWRTSLKTGFDAEFEFLDPTDNLIGRERSDFDVVQADIDAIRSADAVLANMWRESIGTAFGVLHAHDAAKPVVVCDPNLIGNRMLAFYADAVEKSLPAALNSIRTFLAAERQIKGVVKGDKEVQPFDRQKLAKSIRKACLDAGQSDLVPPRAIMTIALGKLIGDDPTIDKIITTEEIRSAVWEAMAELAADPSLEADYDRIRLAWDEFDQATQKAVDSLTARVVAELVFVQDKPLDIPVHSVGTHSTIWGHSVGSEASKIFDEIRRVHGVNEIRFGPFENTGSPPAKPHVRLVASKTPTVIDGKCFDKGPKGTLQTFQIRVADPTLRDAVLRVTRDHLLSKGMVRSQ